MMRMGSNFRGLGKASLIVMGLHCCVRCEEEAWVLKANVIYAPVRSFSSIVRFVVFFLCDESRDVIRMHKSESHLARTQKPSLMQVVPLHLFCSAPLSSAPLYLELRPHYYSRLASRHIYTLLSEILLKRKSTSIIQSP